MQRLFRLSLMAVMLAIVVVSAALAQKPTVQLSGRIAPSDIRILLKDSVYNIDNELVVGGTLIIEPGTTINFFDNGKLIDSVGGRIIADGWAAASYSGVSPDNVSGAPFDARYADLRYFLSGGVINRSTTPEATVNVAKYNIMYNVVLDTSIIDNTLPPDKIYAYQNKRRLLSNLIIGQEPAPGSGKVIIPFEYALIFDAARLGSNPQNDINLIINPWQRYMNGSPNIVNATINFYGQPEGNISREWGHIVILPGARAAFFRNCSFQNFRKDTTEDRIAYFNVNDPNISSWAAAMNTSIINKVNGSGGAISTFSSRTWLINCTFNNDFARYRGGAIQFLQAPVGFPQNLATLVTTYYANNKNPNLTNKDGNYSIINQNNPILATDLIDENTPEPLGDFDRQYYADGRLSIFLGRVRNLTFTNNIVQLANTILKQVGGFWVTMDDNVANYPQSYGNGAYGGAVYIEGRNQMEIGLGINNAMTIGGVNNTFLNPDTYIATGNKAFNLQNDTRSDGAKGGALYLGPNTSLIIAGKSDFNETHTNGTLEDPSKGDQIGNFSKGGAIFEDSLSTDSKFVVVRHVMVLQMQLNF